MARNDIYRARRTGTLVLDVQGLEDAAITSRLVIPLIREDRRGQHKTITRIHPTAEFDGERYVMATHLLASVPATELGQPVGRLDGRWHFVITDAIDALLTGA